MEKSIEERAKWYGYIVKERGDMPCELGESTYIEVATEQKKIDIEKACEWLSERCAFGVHPCSGTALVMEFRKVMEE